MILQCYDKGDIIATRDQMILQCYDKGDIIATRDQMILQCDDKGDISLLLGTKWYCSVMIREISLLLGTKWYCSVMIREISLLPETLIRPSAFTIKLDNIIEPPHDKTDKMTVRPAKTQISLSIRSVWSESSLCAKWVARDPSFLHADSEDSDQTGRMPRLIGVFAGRTCHFVCFVMRRLISSVLISLIQLPTLY